jgi:hypothetical protein
MAPTGLDDAAIVDLLTPTPSPDADQAGKIHDDEAGGNESPASGDEPTRPVVGAGLELRARLSTLLGRDQYPAELAGWGYLHAELAREQPAPDRPARPPAPPRASHRRVAGARRCPARSGRRLNGAGRLGRRDRRPGRPTRLRHRKRGPVPRRRHPASPRRRAAPLPPGGPPAPRCAAAWRSAIGTAS